MKKEKEIKESVGIDVSKLTLDVFIHTKRIHKQFLNNQKGFESLIKWVKQETKNTNEVINRMHRMSNRIKDRKAFHDVFSTILATSLKWYSC
jgi:hypothetical protein